MKKNILKIFIGLFLLMPFCSWGNVVSGILVDSETRSPVVGAFIGVGGNIRDSDCVSGIDGKFSCDLPKSYNFRVLADCYNIETYGMPNDTDERTYALTRNSSCGASEKSDIETQKEQKKIDEVVSAFKEYSYIGVLGSSVTVKDGVIKFGNAAYDAWQEYVKNCNMRKNESESRNSVAEWTDPTTPEIKSGKATYSCKALSCKDGFRLARGYCYFNETAGSSGGGNRATVESKNVSEDDGVTSISNQPLDSVDVIDKGPNEFKMKSAGLINTKTELALSPQQNMYKSLCESKSNAGTWLDSEDTCNCPDGKVWEKSIGRCEEAGTSDRFKTCMDANKIAWWDEETNECVCHENGKEFNYNKKTCERPDLRTPEQKAKDLETKQSAYDAAKEKEQSSANRILTAATTAVTGIGAMQALQGLSEQKADKDADAYMAEYIATMRCSYGNVSRIDVGNKPIELPGGNNKALMNYRDEYFALAESLKERKEALGLMPGIESEVILDKANMGLYDQENTGITSGNYASLYRAKMLNNKTDKTKIEEDATKSANRMKYGAIAAGVGVVGGLVGNSAINGKLGELIKEAKGNAANNRANKDVISKIKTALKNAGVKDINKLDFSNLDLSALSSVMDKIDFTKMSSDLKGKSALDILNTSNKTSFISSFGDVLGESNLNLLNGL
jgi:hypothetical protein